MDLIPNSDQVQVIDTVRQFLADRLPVTRLHAKQFPANEVPADIAAEAAELGLFSMGLPEEAGGFGFNVPEEVLVAREIGRVVGPARFVFNIIAARIAAASGANELARSIGSGSRQAAYAANEDYGNPGACAQMRLFEWMGAEIAIVEDGSRLRLLDITGSAITGGRCADPSLTMGMADLSSAPVLAEVSDSRLAQIASLLVGAMGLGLAEAVRDMITEYAKVRETFGRPIGSYQAVRHPCAEMAARCILAESQLLYAALTIVEGYEDSEAQVLSARLVADDAAMRNTQDNIQLHGGIGVTDEYDAHFFLKRANAAQAWFGEQGRMREHLLGARVRSV